MAAQVWPLHDVQAFMGHADIATTRIYSHHVPKHDAAARFTEFVRAQKSEPGHIGDTFDANRTSANQEVPALTSS